MNGGGFVGLRHHVKQCAARSGAGSLNLLASVCVHDWGRVERREGERCAQWGGGVKFAIVAGGCDLRHFRFNLGEFESSSVCEIGGESICVLRCVTGIAVGIEPVNSAKQTINLTTKGVDDDATLTGIGFTAGRGARIVMAPPKCVRQAP